MSGAGRVESGGTRQIASTSPGRIDELDTPCLTVDLDVFESNLRLCMDRLAGVRVRPNLKTAKSPEVARLLLDAGAVGICVAKLSEAEVMLAGGIDDVLITTELAGPIKARRLAQLISRWPDARVSVVVDSWEGATAIDAALPRVLETLIEVNVGQVMLAGGVGSGTWHQSESGARADHQHASATHSRRERARQIVELVLPGQSGGG